MLGEARLKVGKVSIDPNSESDSVRSAPMALDLPLSDSPPSVAVSNSFPSSLAIAYLNLSRLYLIGLDRVLSTIEAALAAQGLEDNRRRNSTREAGTLLVIMGGIALLFQ